MSNQELWDSVVAKNTDPYGAGAVRYAKAWVELMEARIAGGASVASIAEATSHEADTEGITGFMFGWVVGLLTRCWAHGEELRQWHNSQYPGGEKANATPGAVINPAVMSWPE